MMNNIIRFRNAQLKFQCLSTMLRISAELTKDKSIELPFKVGFIKQRIEHCLKA